jgi:hypothetical protein
LIVLQQDVLLGDSLMSLPLIKILSERTQHRTSLFLQMSNRHTASLIPQRWGYKDIWDVPIDAAQAVKRIYVQDMYKQFGQHTVHPTVGFLNYFGFNEFTEAVRPEIEFNFNEQVPQYDFIISAVSRANGVRMWPFEEWKRFLPQLRQHGTVCMVGTEEDGRPFEDIDYFYGHSLQDSCSLLSKARCVITIDNGIGRLMHAIGGNHVLLCSNAVGQVWGTYPGAHVIYDSPKAFGVERVLSLVRSVI